MYQFSIMLEASDHLLHFISITSARKHLQDLCLRNPASFALHIIMAHSISSRNHLELFHAVDSTEVMLLLDELEPESMEVFTYKVIVPILHVSNPRWAFSVSAIPLHRPLHQARSHFSS